MLEDMIKKRDSFFKWLMLAVIFINIGINAQHVCELELIWSDEFNSGELDMTKWSYEIGTGVNGDWGTGQLDRATSRVENVSFDDNVEGAEDGCLVITTRKENYEDRSYTSGRIRTADKASWGPGHRIVARVYPRDVKYPGQGFAFWMMPQEKPETESHIMWPQGGEIDIMEYVGSIPFNNLGSVHYAWFWENNQYQAWNHGHQGAYYNYENMQVPNPEEPGYGNFPVDDTNINAGCNGFHTYGIDWYNDRIEFFVDDSVYHIHFFEDGDGFTVDGQDKKRVKDVNGRRVTVSEYSHHFEEWKPFEHEMYAILSAGVGGTVNTYGGAIVPEANFPCSVFIDWVRVYKIDATKPSILERGNESPVVSIDVNEETVQQENWFYPNPAENIINFNIPDADFKKYTISIKDITGKTLYTVNNSSDKTLDISSLFNGTYYVVLQNRNSVYSNVLIVK